AEKIVKNVADKNTAATRIFTFGVGDDVNAVLLDQIAEKTRSVSTYVRETEDIEAKVSGLYSKISHPVLTNLKLTVGEGVTVSEIYPPQLPDLFHGGQIVVLGRYKTDSPQWTTGLNLFGYGPLSGRVEPSNTERTGKTHQRNALRELASASSHTKITLTGKVAVPPVEEVPQAC